MEGQENNTYQRFYYEPGSQTWIGNCGFFNPTTDSSILLNGTKYAIYKAGVNVIAGAKALYFLTDETSWKSNH